VPATLEFKPPEVPKWQYRRSFILESMRHFPIVRRDSFPSCLDYQQQKNKSICSNIVTTLSYRLKISRHQRVRRTIGNWTGAIQNPPELPGLLTGLAGVFGSVAPSTLMLGRVWMWGSLGALLAILIGGPYFLLWTDSLWSSTGSAGKLEAAITPLSCTGDR
jgi:hypothetical protein